MIAVTLGDIVVPMWLCTLAAVGLAGLAAVILIVRGLWALRQDDRGAPDPRRPLAPQLRPGDCLLYRAKGIYGLLISLKTWHAVAHCEAYLGAGQSVASRDGIGVGQYPLREAQLWYVLRPQMPPFAVFPAQVRFEREWRGQGYDWCGLLRFAWRAEVSTLRFNNKQFCSEFLTRWYRAGGLDPFNHEDADAIAPSTFLQSNCFTVFEVLADGTVAPRAEVVDVA